MQPDAAKVVGILAGGGALPCEIAAAVAKTGARVVVVGLAGEADPAAFVDHDFTLLRWGEIGALIRTFKSKGVTDLVIVGSVSRPDMSRLKTDLGFYLNLPRVVRIMAAGGDDNVLRRVVRFFEAHQFRVVGPADVAPGLVIAEGPLGAHIPGPEHHRDIAFGLDIVARLAPFDIGQAVVVAKGRVAAIEGAEGTDRMLQRVAERAAAAGGVLVKRPKPGQELRVDMPAIGPETVRRAQEAGLAGIAVAAGATLAAERPALITRADAMQIFVAGVPVPDQLRANRTRRTRDEGQGDGEMGRRILTALATGAASRAVVVVRRHVLAVESGEGVTALIARAAQLKQWGRARWARRRGALVVADLASVSTADVAAAAAGGLSRIVACARGSITAEAEASLRRSAASAGLAIDIAEPEARSA